MSREPIADDQQLTRYLLGLLPDDEAERIDELSIVDDEVAARLSSVENDLVDAYVRGTLEPGLLKPFEAHYLASPRRREKVQFARRFLASIDRAPAAEPVRAVTEPAASAGRAPRRAQRAWLPLAAAALLVACGVLLFQDARLRRGLGEAQEARLTHEHRARSLAGELEQQRAANDAMAQELERARATRPLAAIALVLPPPTRAVGPVSAIAVTRGAVTVPFDLRLESNDFARYEVALRDPAANRIIWRSESLTPALSRRPPTISVSVPAALLKPQHYSLELSGRNSAGTLEIMGSYAFQIDAR